MAELKVIRPDDLDTTRIRAALNIYHDTILLEAQNPERQILYWVKHCNDDVRDEFRCFSIHIDDNVVGYLQYSYFGEEKIFFFEYLCISSKAQGMLYNKDAMSSIERYIAENYPPGFLIVFEVAHILKGKEWVPDSKLNKYFYRLGFRKIEFEYRYPILQGHDGDTSYPADLMIRLPDGRTDILTSDYRTIIRCLYFKHYLRWDRPFLSHSDFIVREKLINDLYWKQLGFVSGHNAFETSGDDRRSSQLRFAPRLPPIRKLLIDIFGEKFVEFSLIVILLIVANKAVDNSFLFIPFMMIAFAAYCLLQNTPASAKLFTQIIGKFKSFLPQR